MESLLILLFLIFGIYVISRCFASVFRTRGYWERKARKNRACAEARYWKYR